MNKTGLLGCDTPKY